MATASATTQPGDLLASLHGAWPAAAWPGPSELWWPQPSPVRASRANALWRSRRCRCGSWVAELVATQ
eukprot:4242307-Alexandrium_andersonii.AAC.1